MSNYNPHPESMRIQQALNLALEHHRVGRLAEAEAIYRQILAQQPNHADAMHLSGAIAHQMGRSQDAVELIRRAIDINPGVARYHNNLGTILKTQGQPDAAIEAYRRAIQLEPDYVQAYGNLGDALLFQGRFAEAEEAYQKVLRLESGHAETHNKLGAALAAQGELQAAIESYQGAIRIQPDHAESYNNLANALVSEGRIAEAIAAYRTAMQLQPQKNQIHSNLIFTLYYDPASKAQDIHQELLNWNHHYAMPLKKYIVPHSNDRNPDRRLKIGYVSADFREHSCDLFLDPLLSKHNHERFEIFCYAEILRPDHRTRQYQSYADHWRNIAGLSDEQVAEQIRRDGIDILVDLKLHSDQNRLLVFARKPAPVQVTWLGYPGSTGLDTIDYRFSDSYLDPLETDLRVYSEQTMRLPDCFWCYDPLTSEPQISDLPATANGYITFGCLNKFDKVNSDVLMLWAKVLLAAPKSHLLLLAPQGQIRKNIPETLFQRGISSERIEFVDRRARVNYLELYNKIDLTLDPFPYNGHTTSLDSLWMGVPVVTLCGQTAMGRAGKSFLTNIGLSELVAQTEQEYVNIAVKLSSDLPRLKELRTALRRRMENSPLMDAKRFARNMESAYRDMWRKWCSDVASDAENR